MNKNVIDSIIASVIFGLLSTGLGLLLQAWGVSTRVSIIFALLALLTLFIIFLILRTIFQKGARWLTERLLENALQLQGNEADNSKIAFKQKIVGRVLQENPIVEQEPNDSTFTEYLNQLACENIIAEEFSRARTAKILTIRGEKYFVGTRSLLHDICLEKKENGHRIEVLVLSPRSGHITKKLAEDLGHNSADHIRRKMEYALNYLIHLEELNPNIQVKCYDETPNFKMLMFDNVMFVSSFAGGSPKNDMYAKMYYLTRDGNPLFVGFERYFDNLSKHSVSLQESRFAKGL
ncbi:MAG: hypothetical protein ACYDER_16755 [Ktedonobacteraceae bacterium]